SGLLQPVPGFVDGPLLAIVLARMRDSGASLLGAASHARGWRRTCRGARLREQVGTGRGGPIDPPSRRSPDDGAVGQLPIAPPTERLEPMVLAAKAFEVFPHRVSTGCRALVVERDRVVQVAHHGRAATPREAAGQIPASHGTFER